jgi:site-specific recombinase XerC
VDETENKFEDLRLRKKQGGRHLLNGNSKYPEQFKSCERWLKYIKSESTRNKYKITLTGFCLNRKINPDELIELSDQEITEQIENYIMYLLRRVEDGNLSGNSSPQFLNGVKSLLNHHHKQIWWNDIMNLFPDDGDAPDIRKFTDKEIEDILTHANERESCMVLIQTSAGIRVGALVKCTIDSLYPLIVNNEKNEIKVGSIKLNGYDTSVALVKVYWKSKKWRYFSFITKECREAINKYLALRSNCIIV